MNNRFNLANALSFSRLLLTPVVAWFVTRHSYWSIALFGIVVLTDFADGYFARARNQESRFGTLLDHGADATFVVTLTALFALDGALPVMLPVMIGIAFIHYAIGSPDPAAPPQPSTLGRWNGIAYYVVVGAAIVLQYDRLTPLGDVLLPIAGWCLVLTTAVSIFDRATRVRRR